jgi:hypothetical protein
MKMPTRHMRAGPSAPDLRNFGVAIAGMAAFVKDRCGIDRRKTACEG